MERNKFAALDSPLGWELTHNRVAIEVKVDKRLAADVFDYGDSPLPQAGMLGI